MARNQEPCQDYCIATRSIQYEFGQNAIVWAGDDAVPQLVLLR